MRYNANESVSLSLFKNDSMDENQAALKNITHAIQERKGKKITIVDMSALEHSICRYFVICEGTSNTHILAISDFIREHLYEKMRIKPFAAEGYQNALWIILDYGEIMVHVFHPESRQYYDLEHLWNDAVLTEIPDLN